MNDMEQATETLVYEQQDDQARLTTNPASRVGEDLDIDYWTMLMEARITKSRKPKSTKEELLKGVPVKEKVIPLPEAERVCQECGADLKPCGKKFIRDEWNFQPARLTVTRIYAETYCCPECKKESGKKDSDTGNNLVTAKVPDALIPHSMATNSL